MTGEVYDINHGEVEKAKFEYSLRDKVFNKGLEEHNKTEGFFKSLKNIEDNDKEQSRNELKLLKVTWINQTKMHLKS